MATIRLSALRLNEEAHMQDVVIVGSGPVGAGLAIELGQRGIGCVLVERHPQPQPVPKGQNLTQRSGEHFRAWGVAKEIRAACPIPHEFGSTGVTCYGALLSGYAHDWLRRAEVRAYYAADNERLPQYCTEQVLRARAAQLSSVQVRYGWSVEGVRQDESGTSVTLAERKGTGREELRTRYVVGCDGSRSVVRDSAGIEQTLDRHGKRMVLLVFRSLELHQLLERFPGKSYFKVLRPELEGYWQFFGRVDLDGRWFFHAPVPDDATADNFDFTARLWQAAGAEFAMELEHLGFWDLRIAIARNYRKGRVLLAGDSAHSHPPYGGYGINTGFEDARNLGWKLAAELQGWGGPALLNSYGTERRPVFVSTAKDYIARLIDEDRAFVAAHDPLRDRAGFEAAWNERAKAGNLDVLRFAPQYEGSPIVCGPAGGRSHASGGHEARARAGHHLCPQPLADGRCLFDALGEWFTLVALDAPAAVPSAFQTAAQRMGVPLRVVKDSRRGGREAYQCSCLLVRPDQFVAWAGEAGPQDTEAILRRAVGHVHCGRTEPAEGES